MANNIFNDTIPLSGPLLTEHGKSPLKMFSGVNVSANLNNIHTSGCPVYVLNNTLQSGKCSIPNWDPRARLGINMVPSPHHTRSANLVLNLTLGLVSPQFHIVHDDFFETVRPSASNEKTVSIWKILAGFVKHKSLVSEGGINIKK